MICKKCGIYTTNIAKHLGRKRCEKQHIRKIYKRLFNESSKRRVWQQTNAKREDSGDAKELLQN